MTMEIIGSSSSSEPLHNFTLPNGLRWGNQKFLRCRKVNVDRHISAVKTRPSPSYSSFGGVGGGCNGGSLSLADGNTQMIKSQTVKGIPRRSDNHSYCFNDSNKKRKTCFSSSKPPLPSEKRLRMAVGGGVEDDVNGIAAVREKVILDFRNEAVKMKDEILRKENFRDDVSKTPVVEDGVKPWNLRIRRAELNFKGCKVGGAVDCGGDRENNPEIIKSNSNTLMASPLRVTGDTTSRRRSSPSVTGTDSSERPKFSIPITRREIEEDFVAMVGRKPNRRPKKRAKCVQKTLDKLFPGLWLTEITADMYKVSETQ